MKERNIKDSDDIKRSITFKKPEVISLTFDDNSNNSNKPS